MSPLHHIHQFSGETLCVSTAGHTADLRKSGFINSDAHLKKKTNFSINFVDSDGLQIYFR